MPQHAGISATELAATVEARDEAVIETILGFQPIPECQWGIRRSDGLFWNGGIRGSLVRTFGPENVVRFPSQTSAQHYIDVARNGIQGRADFAGCVPALIPEPGDHIVCTACGQVHEADYCPTQAGNGAAL